MPASYSMSWEPTARRWWKQYNGKRYVVSCRQLGVEPTKEESYQAANAWWREKLAELAESTKIAHPHAKRIAVVEDRIQWALDHGKPSVAKGLRSDLEILVEDEENDLGSFAEKVVTPTEVSATVWKDRLSEERELKSRQTVGDHIERRLSTLQKRVQADGLTPGSFANTRDCLYHFRDWIGTKTDPRKINADTLEDFHGYLLGKIAERRVNSKKGWSVDFAKKVFGQAKAFVVYLAGKGMIPLPTNVASRDFKFGSTLKTIVTMTEDEVSRLIGGATGQLRLHLLLMLNCGMTQTDISDLKDSEVDWDKGRITRKRSKTEDQTSTPTVSYPLWRETFKLLRRHRSGGEIVLRTMTSGLWAWEELGSDGKLRSSDNIATNYKRLRVKLGIDKSLKIFRKTSATKIESSTEYRHFRPLFLGHAPQGIGEIHYANHSPANFDKAVEWLGEQYGY